MKRGVLVSLVRLVFGCGSDAAVVPGGDRIAIHGTDDPASVGTAASHGCMRVGDSDIRLLIAKVPLGTPVVIHA